MPLCAAHKLLRTPITLIVALSDFSNVHATLPPTSRKEKLSLLVTPIKNPKLIVWYTNTHVGHNTLRQTVKLLYNEAGIPGFKTNHSLKVTSATRLFQSEMDE